MFLQRNIPYEARLYKMKISDSENCKLCNTKETILHLYWECPNSARLWERLKYIVEHHLKTPLHLNPLKCMLGIGDWPSKKNKENIWLLSILTKHYIHLNKCNEGENSPRGLDNYLRSTLRMEREASKKKGMYNLFCTKWGKLIDWLDQ